MPEHCSNSCKSASTLDPCPAQKSDSVHRPVLPVALPGVVVETGDLDPLGSSRVAPALALQVTAGTSADFVGVAPADPAHGNGQSVLGRRAHRQRIAVESSRPTLAFTSRRPAQRGGNPTAQARTARTCSALSTRQSADLAIERKRCNTSFDLIHHLLVSRTVDSSEPTLELRL